MSIPDSEFSQLQIDAAAKIDAAKKEAAQAVADRLKLMLAGAVSGQSSAEQKEGILPEFLNGDQILMGATPLRAKSVVLDGFEYAAGLYIASGATGAGKTLTGAALVHYFMSHGNPGGFLYVNEARAVPGFLTMKPDGSPRPLAAWLYYFIGELAEIPAAEIDWSKYLLSTWAAGLTLAPEQRKVSMLVIDSITLPMRGFAENAKEGRKGEPTMEQGMQPSDILFCRKLQEWAFEHNVILIGLVNEELVPFSSKLEGVTEGSIEIVKPGKFIMRNRVTRTPGTVQLGATHLNYASEVFLGYGKFRGASEQQNTGDVEIPGSYQGLQPAPNPETALPLRFPQD